MCVENLTVTPPPPHDSTNPKDRLGAKKPRLSLIPPSGLVYAALAMQYGAEEKEIKNPDGTITYGYGAYNWRQKKVQSMIYLEACMRHLLSWLDGEESAEDSGVPHLGHAIACLLILIDAKETGNMVDNRPSPGAMAALIEKWTKKDPK